MESILREVSSGGHNKLFQEESELRVKRRRVVDRWVRWIIAGGGFAIIASILTILFFIGIEVIPLFQPADVALVGNFSAAGLLGSPVDGSKSPLLVGLEENQEVGYAVFDNGVVQFFDVEKDSPREQKQLQNLGDGRITAVWQSLDGTRIACGTDDGNVFDVDLQFNTSFFEGDRSYRPVLTESSPVLIDSSRSAITDLARGGAGDERSGFAVITAGGDVLLSVQTREESLFGDAEVTIERYELEKKWTGTPVAIALEENVHHLYVGTDEGKVYHWSIFGGGTPVYITSVAVSREEDVDITAMDLLIGSRTLIVGDSGGGVDAYSLVRDSTIARGWRFTKIHDMADHDAPVVFIAPSARGKGFISGDRDGNLLLQYTTSERLLAEFRIQNDSPIRFINFTPKANGVVVLDGSGTLTRWMIDNPHPEASFKAFFGKVWYEGYPEPDYVWQSSAATDDFEPKLSVVPLIFGSLKGTFYALILAVPLAIMAALYTSQFMHPTFRNYVKPTVEIMAALPSVVLGFLAGLWLAPIIEKVVPGVFLMMVTLPVMFLVATLFWRMAPLSFRNRFKPGVEATLLIPVIIGGVWICLQLSGWAEAFFFDGNFTQWVYNTFDFNYDQRNAMIVGFAMGFAVIPIIYTISEDAMSNVPQHLISGSLALGATRWQTAVRVVIPTAAAGVFSAIMIGFGRAVGETMIVLMATGNTPIMDWNIFNGFRTLSANIAVEIPEAPHGGTLYRLLFLTALLLFVITFLVNTGAEIVRQRVREKYQKL